MDAVAELDIKQRLARLSGADRRSISAYLVRLKHASDEGKVEISRLMSDMDADKKTKLSDFENSLEDG